MKDTTLDAVSQAHCVLPTRVRGDFLLGYVRLDPMIPKGDSDKDVSNS